MANKDVEKKSEVKPWLPLSDLGRRESDMMDLSGRRPWAFPRSPWSMSRSEDVSPPVVDLYDEKYDVVVKGELPGMGKG